MNIGIDIRCLMDKQRTGVGEYAFGLLNAVFKIDKGNQYFLFYNSHQDVSQNIPPWDFPNVRFISVRWPNKLFNVLLMFGLIKLDKMVSKKHKVESRKLCETGNWKLKIDVWFSPNLNFTSLTSKTKFILTIHDLSFEFLPKCYTFKQRLWHRLLRPRKQCKRADVILTPSENTRRDVEAKYKVESRKVKVLRPGLSTTTTQNPSNRTQVKEKYSLPEEFVLFLGTIEPRKNVEAVIGAFARMYDTRHRAYGLVIAGSKGWKNEVVFQMIANTPNVRYIDYVSEEDKPALYKLASLFVYPSLYEGFGLPVLEAMACGTPVITSHRASLPEVGGDAVYYVNPANVAELSVAMELVLKNEDLRLKMVERQRGQAKKFNWEKSAGEFVSLVSSGVSPVGAG